MYFPMKVTSVVAPEVMPGREEDPNTGGLDFVKGTRGKLKASMGSAMPVVNRPHNSAAIFACMLLFLY